MNQICVVVADASRARIFTFQDVAVPGGTFIHELLEVADLADPLRRHRPSELLSESRRASSRAPNGRAFTVSDHREAYLDDLDRRFAVNVVERTTEVVRQAGAQNLVIAASPRFLGRLRHQLTSLARLVLQLHQVPRDFTRFSRAQLHDRLAELGLVPRRGRLGLAEPATT